MTQRQALSIPLSFSSSESEVAAQPVTVAVPFSRGAVLSTNELQIEDSAGNSLECTILPTGFWPDQSVKWCVVKWVAQGMGNVNLKSTGNTQPDGPPVGNEAAVVVDESQDSVRISSGGFVYTFHRSAEKIFPDVMRDNVPLISSDDVAIAFKSNIESHLEEASLHLVLHGASTATVKVDAALVLAADRRLKVTFEFEITAGWLSATVEIHNPHRAQHKGAIWELGDEGSVIFSEFAIEIARANGLPVRWRCEPGTALVPAVDNSYLLQASSGGEHWDSPTHVDVSGDVPNLFRGYRIMSEGEITDTGNRASPQVTLGTEAEPLFSFTCKQYWQNFPKCIEVNKDDIKLGLFPRQHGSEYELQGGERKLHGIVFSFYLNSESLHWVDNPLVVSVSPDYIATTGVLRYHVSKPQCQQYNQIISTSHDEASGFLAKREQIDEYGWRNFGDIFADHETLYHDASDIFVSHYNNQYDPIYGFARQFLMSGDSRWRELLVDLANHVMDIDIYRTDEDRAEYNHGLFWHTDHYKRAYTCTHRTYANQHYPVDWAGDKGGGPGSEHCYTSGLLLYYQLTGNVDARDAVLGLTSWIRYYYEGTGTILEAGKRLATDDRRNAIAICRGQQVFRYQYDFDRGVGNYIRALLDSYEVSLQHDYIDQAEKVMQRTFGCNDDIAARELDDIEDTWYYTIFLQEIIRYLDLKRTLNEMDGAFVYARDALLYYARWMADNEQPYLERPDRLEYPNDTWIAQDIRKANILYAAYRYATVDRDKLLLRARFFRDYVVNALSQSETRHFARIQIIMLQNHGPSDLMEHAAEPYPGLDDLPGEERSDNACFFTPASFVGYLFAGWGRALVNFNPKNEIKWVRARLG